MNERHLALFIIFLFMLCFCEKSGAQDLNVIDSLNTVISDEKDSENKVENYLTIAEEYTHNDTDSSIVYINEAIGLAQKLNYREGLAEAYFMQSYSYDMLGDYPQAISSLETAIDLFIELEDSSYLTGCYNNLGVLYSYGSNQRKSVEYFVRSIQIGEASRDSFSLAEAYSNVAGFYEDLKEYSSALKYYKKALQVDIDHNDSENIAVSEVDVAYMNIKLLRFDDALLNLNNAKDLMGEMFDPYYKTILFQRFANYYKETGELELAKEEINKAQKQVNLFNSPAIKADLLGLKSEILVNQKKFKAAITAVDSAITLSKQIDSRSFLPDLYEVKAEALFGLGKYSQGYTFLQKANDEKEEIKANEVAEYLSEFERQETAKEERTQMVLEQQLKTQKSDYELMRVRSKLYFTIVLSVFLGLLMSIALYLFLLKQNHAKKFESNFALINHQKELIEKNYYELKENEERLSKLNATKDKFFSIIAHDLKNPFNTLIGVSEIMLMDKDIRNSEEFDDFVKGMHETAKSGYSLLENLLQWSRSQIGSIKFEPRQIKVDELFVEISSMFKEVSKTKKISISIIGEKNCEIYADYNMLCFILRNLLDNAIKFSPPDDEVELDVYLEKEDETVIRVIDYGIGMSSKIMDKLFKIEHSVQRNGTADEKGTGLGLILCKEFIEKNGGKIVVESEEGQGSIFNVSLPPHQKFANKLI